MQLKFLRQYLHLSKSMIESPLSTYKLKGANMDNTLKGKLLVKDKWLRGLFMLFFIIIKYLVAWLIILIALFQFVADLLIGKPNDKLLEFTKHLNTYLLQIVNFLTFNSESKPFPFANWPSHEKK